MIKSVDDERVCLPLFSHPLHAVSWMRSMEIDNAEPTFPMGGRILRAFLEEALASGIRLATINPSSENHALFACAPIEKLITQVSA